MALIALKKLLRVGGERLIRAADQLPRAVLQRTMLTAEQRGDLERNRRFQDVHRGRRAFVIGNGASLKGQDLSCLGGEVTFAVNSFWQHPVVELWQPTYYSFVDPDLFVLEEPTVPAFYRSLRQRVTRSTFFVPLFYYEPLPTRRLLTVDNDHLPADQTYYVALDSPISRDRDMDIDLTAFIHSVFNVVQLSIVLALYMRCDPIYLLGLDHDWLAHRSEERHFYDKEVLRWSLPWAPPSRPDGSYRALMLRQLQLWHNYETLAAVARERGIRILNATDGGYLDVFPRVAYESLFPETDPGLS
jgi:hypothetical protein